METSFLTIRMVAHHFQITAIRKLPNLALCRLPAIVTQSLDGGGLALWSIFRYSTG